ncbi:MAG: hypothetical protein D6793_11290 [Thermoflexia bacterium]|nr:MAG: hypothetical protein D6793_11290 [Thermoflexia bacterium]
MKKRSQRFALLVYTPLRRWGALGLLTAIVTGAFWFLMPRVLGPTPLRPLLLLAVLAALMLWAYGSFAPRVASVRCEPHALRVQGPLMPLVISYRRVERTRSVSMSALFDPRKDRAVRRWPPEYLNMTAVAVDLTEYPVQRWWLRLWFDRHLFQPDRPGLVFLVEDWLALSRQLDGALSAYRARRARRA